MAYTVELSARAETDVREAYNYVRKHGPANPDDWKAGLARKLASLEELPERCALAPENEYTQIDVRQLLYGRFRILFMIREDTIVSVLAVRHGARRFLKSDEIEEQ